MSLVRFRFWARRCSSMVEHQPSKLNTWVRFPSPALKMNILFIMREWLSWWSTTLPRSGSRVRVPSRALLIYKRYPKRIPFVYKRVLPDSNGSRSPLCSGRCRTDIHRMSCTVSRSNRKKLESIYARVLPDSNGSRSPLCSGRCRTDIHRMSCTVSHSNRKKLESIYMQESCRTRMFKGRIVFFVL